VHNWPKVAIIVLNWNGWRDTIECLESLQRLTYPNYQIIVVDNGSTDGSVEKIKAWAKGENKVKTKFSNHNPRAKPVYWVEYNREVAEIGGIVEKEKKLAEFPPSRRMVLIQTGENLGFAGGNNVGIKYALAQNSKYILLLNNDTVVNANFLSLMVEAAEADESVGIIGSKIYYYDHPQKIWFAGGSLCIWRGSAYHFGQNQLDTGKKFSGVANVDFVTGCVMLIKSRLLQDTGLLDEAFFLYVEDVDFCYRALEAGWKVSVCLDAQVWHKVGTAAAQNTIAWYYYIRNRPYWVFRKVKGHAGSKAAFVVFYTFSRLWRLAMWMVKNQMALVRVTVRGICDFLMNNMGSHDTI